MPRPRLHLTAPVAPEDELHRQVAQALGVLLLPPAEWSTFPAGHVPLPAQFAAKLARLGVKRNWPDLLVIYQGVYGIELKRRGSCLSRTRVVHTLRGSPRLVEGQRDVFPRLEAAGMRIAVADSVDAVIAALSEWQIPMRRIAPIPARGDRGLCSQKEHSL